MNTFLQYLSRSNQCSAQHGADSVLAVCDTGTQFIINHELDVSDCLSVSAFAHCVLGVVSNADAFTTVLLQGINEGAHRPTTVAFETDAAAISAGKARFETVFLPLDAADGIVIEM